MGAALDEGLAMAEGESGMLNEFRLSKHAPTRLLDRAIRLSVNSLFDEIARHVQHCGVAVTV